MPQSPAPDVDPAGAATAAAVTTRVAAIVAASGSLEAVLEAVLEEMVREGLRGGCIALVDEDGMLRLAAAEGDVDRSVRDLRIPVGSGIMGRVAADGQPAIVDDIDAPDAPRAPSRNVGSNAALRSLVAVPLFSADEIIGVLEVDSSEPGRFGPDDVATLRRIADAVAGSVRSARDLGRADENLRRRMGELQLLAGLARDLGRDLDEQAIVRRLLAAAWAVAEGADPGVRAAALLRPGDPSSELIVRTAAGVEVHTGAAGAGAEGIEGALRQWLTEIGCSGPTLVSPLSLEDGGGALLACITSERRAGERVRQRLLDAVADLGALALAHAQLVRRALESANAERDAAQRTAAAERARSRLMLLVSHELRGPLTVMSGYLDMLGDGSIPAERVGLAVAPMTEATGRLTSLVDRILDTARLEAGTLDMTTRPIDLAALVTQIVADRPDGDRVRPQLAPAVAAADPERLRQAIEDLVDNALKFSPTDSLVEVRLENRGDRAVIVVRDHGPGVAWAELERIFSPFGREVHPDDRHIGGSGLGLHLARQIARLHGGDVVLRHTSPAGSTFELSIPLIG